MPRHRYECGKAVCVRSLSACTFILVTLLLLGCGGGETDSGLDLPSMALSQVDLPGFSLEREGYVDSEQGAIATYDRVFSATDEGTIGHSHLFYLNSHIDLFSTRGQARAYVRALEFAMEDSSELFADGFADATGGIHEMVASRPLRLPDLGDAAAGIWLAFQSRAGIRESLYIVAQVGRRTTGLLVGARQGQLEAEDLIALVETVVERLRSRFPDPPSAPAILG